VEFVVILDWSSSMSGKPWKQAQSTMAKIVALTKNNSKIEVKILAYSLQPTANFVNRLNAEGSTNFYARKLEGKYGPKAKPK
jgi:cobalamin biosynthesis protein CobT